MDSNSAGRGTIVVGVDGSAWAQHALRWAAAEARLRGSRLLIVHAWRLGYTGVPGGGYGGLGGSPDSLPGGGISDMHRAAEELLDKATADVRAEGIEIERRVVEGDAAGVLVEAAGAADLLVVGSRGHGGLAGLLLGSVGQQCAHDARCPVVIVRAPTDGRLRTAALAGQPDEAAHDRPVGDMRREADERRLDTVVEHHEAGRLEQGD